jgi:cytochrome c biogenesis protein CcmG, thiol:disulfide interchange protein DsbE
VRSSWVPLALSICLGCSRAEGGEHTGGSSAGATAVEIGLPAPAYAAVGLGGDSVSLAKLRGRPVLLNVWATWCIPCRVEVPVVERLHQRYGPKGLDVIGVSVDAPGQTTSIHNFMDFFGVTYPIWLDPDKQVLRRFLAIGVPATFIIGADGTLLYRYMGPVKEGDPAMHRIIQASLAAVSPKQ